MLDVLPLPDVGPDAPQPPPAPPERRPPIVRRWRRPTVSRRWRRFGGGVLLAASVLTLLWWHHAVTADPGLEFGGGANVFRSAPGDVTGITHLDNTLGTEVRVEFEPGGGFMAFFGLANHGPRDVRIEAVRPQGFYYWGLDGVALSENSRTSFLGTEYGPFHPFTLKAGETQYIRLDFRLAGCDPAGLQDNGYSVVDSLPVTYKVLGFRRTVSVPFGKTALSVLATGECNHPSSPGADAVPVP